MTDRLKRSRRDRVLGGVCGGLARYLRIEVSLVRLFFVVLTLGDGIGLILYLILWAVVPMEAEWEEATVEQSSEAEARSSVMAGVDSRPRGPALQWVGAALIVLGGYHLLRNLGFEWLRWLDFNLIWPVLLIGAGVVVLVRREGADD